MFCFECGTRLEEEVVVPPPAPPEGVRLPPLSGEEVVVPPPAPPEGVRPRTRAAGRRCDVCKLKANAERRRKNPIHTLKTRFYNSARKRWPAAKHLWTDETVRAVYERCEGKCTVSGNSDIEQLCISSKKRDRDGSPPTLDDLVLLTTHEARSEALSKNTNRKKRKEVEPPPPKAGEVQQESD